MKRRDFLLGAAGAGAVAAKDHHTANSGVLISRPPSIQEYRTLGRTGFQASDIGCGSPMEEGILNALLMQGVN